MKRLGTLLGLATFASMACGTGMSVTVASSAQGYYVQGVYVEHAIYQTTTFHFDISATPLPPTSPYETIVLGTTFSSSGFGDYSGKTPTGFSPISDAVYTTYPGTGKLASLATFAGGGIAEADITAHGPDGDPNNPGLQLSGPAIVQFWKNVQPNPVEFHAVSSHCFMSSGQQVCVPEEYDDVDAHIIRLSLDGATLPAVPELASMPMLVTGLALLAARARRRVVGRTFFAASRVPTQGALLLAAARCGRCSRS